jgi:hypothetical protein
MTEVSCETSSIAYRSDNFARFERPAGSTLAVTLRSEFRSEICDETASTLGRPGYGAQVAPGKTVRQVPLPPANPEQPDVAIRDALTLDVTRAVTVHLSPSSKRSMDVR